MSTLHVRGLTKRFGDVVALDAVNLEVHSGSLTAVLGPSGCGKTTLLRLVAGFERPDGGEIAFADRVVAGPGAWVTPQRRRVGYLPQEGALFPHLDVAANVGFGLPRVERTRTRVAELLDLVELPASFATRQPHELSGGQQQRVSLARAMAPRPSVVLLDEPFSALDTALRASTGRAVARALRAAGATAVLVTHDQGEALSLADQVVVMRKGRVVQADSPQGIYDRPSDAELARFVGGATVLPGTSSGSRVSTVVGEVTSKRSHEGAVEVVIRPEQVRLGGTGVVARVEEVSYFGHEATLRLRTADGSALLARVGAGSALPEVGTEVRVRVDTDVLSYPFTAIS
ncbi:MAG: ABC transporter ATP-binding protein [Nocardioides sp.]|uniref:ABC transporter ATP-binding protein n=1 Tax=Nocardioides sp. TaxID=35761 RepID=UPI003F032DD1